VTFLLENKRVTMQVFIELYLLALYVVVWQCKLGWGDIYQICADHFHYNSETIVRIGQQKQRYCNNKSGCYLVHSLYMLLFACQWMKLVYEQVYYDVKADRQKTSSGFSWMPKPTAHDKKWRHFEGCYGNTGALLSLLHGEHGNVYNLS